jgi:hypothetical protein
MKENQVYKLKEGQDQAGLPLEVTITKIDGDAIFITSSEGSWESTEEIIETFYDPKEDFSIENMPKLSMDAIDEVVSLIEIFVSTQNPIAGLQAKTKLLGLKDNIAKVGGIKSASPASILGKKVL